MNTKNLLLILVTCLLAGFYACVKDENEELPPIEYGYEYFPLAVGKYRVFQIDSILFDTIAGKIKTDSFRTFLKEEIVDTFKNGLGETVFRIERYERKKASDVWTVRDVASAERSKANAIRTEQNFRLIKMTFPLRVRQSWKSTLYVDDEIEVKAGKKDIQMFKNWESEVKEIGKETSLLGKKYSDVLTITQADDENQIELRRVTEKYAKGIGLIANEMEILDTQAAGSSATWRKKAQKGFIVKQYLIEYN